MLLSALLYAPGSLIYLSAQWARTGHALNGFGWGLLLVIWVAAIFAGWMLWSGQLSL